MIAPDFVLDLANLLQKVPPEDYWRVRRVVDALDPGAGDPYEEDERSAADRQGLIKLALATLPPVIEKYFGDATKAPQEPSPPEEPMRTQAPLMLPPEVAAACKKIASARTDTKRALAVLRMIFGLARGSSDFAEGFARAWLALLRDDKQEQALQGLGAFLAACQNSNLITRAGALAAIGAVKREWAWTRAQAAKEMT